MSEYDLAGIGNAMVDVLATVDDAFLEEQTLDKGAMTLVDMDRVKEIYAKNAAGARSLRRVVW